MDPNDIFRMFMGGGMGGMGGMGGQRGNGGQTYTFRFGWMRIIKNVNIKFLN